MPIMYMSSLQVYPMVPSRACLICLYGSRMRMRQTALAPVPVEREDLVVSNLLLMPISRLRSICGSLPRQMPRIFTVILVTGTLPR